MPIPPTTLRPFEDAVDHAVRQKRRLANDYRNFAGIFVWTFVGFCVGGIFIAERIGALAFGLAWTLCAILVVVLLNTSRSVNAEADRLEVYAAEGSTEARKRIVEELRASKDEESSVEVSAFREALANAKLQ
jgi:hypothetical protein